MKKNIIKDSKDLIKLKESFNKAFDTQIRVKQIEERVSNLDKLGFGEIKSLFEGISDKLFDTNKDCVAKYIKTIKENKELKTLYVLFENALKPEHVNDASLLVSSMVAISEGIDKKSLKEGIKRLQAILKEAVIKSNITADESLSYILTNKKTASNLFEHTNKVHNVVSYINENMASDNVLSNDASGKAKTELVNDLNEAISCDTPWETEAIRDLTICYLSESNSEDLFNKYKDECILLLNEKIEDANTMEEGIRFSTMKESLSKKEFDKSKLKESILTLAELKYTLINE